MSDVESEVNDELENPNPESDIGADSAAHHEEEIEAQVVGDADVNAAIANPAPENAGDSDNASKCDNLESQNPLVDDHNERICLPERDSCMHENENPSGLLAEGDQHQNDSGVVDQREQVNEEDGDANNSYSLAAEDEQYVVQGFGASGCSLEPESEIKHSAYEVAAAYEKSDNTNRNPKSLETERTESSAHLNDYEPRSAESGNVHGEINVAEEAGASAEGSCLVPESESQETVLKSEASVSLLENEPTESDQEREPNENLFDQISNRPEPAEDEMIMPNIGAAGGIVEPENSSSVEIENVQNSNEPVVIEDEMRVHDLSQGLVPNSCQPECDQSDVQGCEGDSSHHTVDSNASNSTDSSAFASHAESDGIHEAGDEKTSETESLVVKLPNTYSNGNQENVTKTENIEVSQHKGAIPKSRHGSGSHVQGKSDVLCDNKAIDSVEEELLSELDATLKQEPDIGNDCLTNRGKLNEETSPFPADDSHFNNPVSVACEQCVRNNLKCSFRNSGGLGDLKSSGQSLKELKGQLKQAKQMLLDRECDINRLREDLEDHRVQCDTLAAERDADRRELDRLRQHNPDDLYIPQIKELEYTIAQQQTEVKGLKEKLSSHDASAKRAIATLQNEMKVRVDQVTKQYEDACKEKDSMVMKFAQAEHKNLECQKQAERAESKLRDMEKERTLFLEKMKAVKDQRSKLAVELEAKNSELSGVNKELDKQRELVSSGDVRVKWAQNKLKAELEAHKDTKTQLEKMTAKLKEAKEETQQIRQDCQAIIKTYQESEEVKSNSLDKELKQKESELLENQVQRTNFELAHVKTQRELEQIRGELQESHAKLSTLNDKLSNVEAEKDNASLTVSKYGEIIQKQKKEIQELRERVESLVQYRTDFTSAQEMIKSLDSEISELKISNKELIADMESCRRRESDKLELTAKLSRKNAELQSENTTLSNKVLTLTGEVQAMKMEAQDVDTKMKELISSLEKEQKLRQEESQTFNTKLAGKCKAVEDLSRKLEDEKDEIKTLKRKHANNIKDLTRQLQQVRRKLENYEASTNGDKDTVSLGSRTSSNGSLNTVGIAEQTVTQVVQPSHAQNSIQHRNPSPEQEYPVITEQIEVDKNTLIDRIVKLQKMLARKNDKIEFMEDHINQLVDEIQKKNKIIQSYFLKEETGTMTSEVRDRSKAEISRKHSIMGSVYSSHSTDGTMTLDLSLQINRKLQAVLEDTLIKNMTLKENLDTLGQEIARLSQENRTMQLQMHAGKSRSRTNPAPR